MPQLYLSTDSVEALELIEAAQTRKTPPRYTYINIDVKEGKRLEDMFKREIAMSFNPMCIVNFGESFSEDRVGDIAVALAKKGLRSVYFDSEQGWVRFEPHDLPFRNDLLRFSHQKAHMVYNRTSPNFHHPSYSLLRYSNNSKELFKF